MTNEELEMLRQSNAIEGVYSSEALDDAVQAWEYAKENEDVNILWLLTIHEILMRQWPKVTPGKFRDCDVFIGGRQCQYLGAEELQRQVGWALDAVNQNLCDPKLAHVIYEHIHPFRDGNGRTGRILYNIHLLKTGKPIHVIKESERLSYYKWFV